MMWSASLLRRVTVTPERRSATGSHVPDAAAHFSKGFHRGDPAALADLHLTKADDVAHDLLLCWYGPGAGTGIPAQCDPAGTIPTGLGGRLIRHVEPLLRACKEAWRKLG